MDVIRKPGDWVLGIPRHIIVHRPSGRAFVLGPARDDLAASDCLTPEDFVARPIDASAAALLSRDELGQLCTEAKLMALVQLGPIKPIDLSPVDAAEAA
jgi:hypothetical protein